MSLDLIPRTAYNEDHEAFRQTVRRFLQDEIAPNAEKWGEDAEAASRARRLAAELAAVERFLRLVHA